MSAIPVPEPFFYGLVSIAWLESTSCCTAASLEISLILSKPCCLCCHSLKRRDLGKNQPVKHNPFCIFKICFSQLVLWQTIAQSLFGAEIWGHKFQAGTFTSLRP